MSLLRSLLGLLRGGTRGADVAPSSSGGAASREGASASRKAESTSIDGTRARELVQAGALLIDVRTPGEFAGGAIAGARNIPVDQISGRVAELNVGKVVVLYCRSGARSGSAMSTLRAAGVEAYNLGPMSAW